MKRTSFATALMVAGLTAVVSVATATAADLPEKTVDLGRVVLHKEVVYGPTGPDAPLLAAFILKSEKPTPVFVQIISGGWRSNPIRIPDGRERPLLERFRPYFDAGFSVVQVSHR
ncbi:MAG: hypothetical protein ACYTG0_04725, partial [Planctomycetota bacterium]